MIDRTEHDDVKGRKGGDKIDDDPHPDHSLDPNEHYGQESDIPTENELRDLARAARD
ncbi:MAG TPA: hypothetical protein VL333_04310 [Candidatus Saccharimonadales bacterium]|nr:hypothetical protein [Candidatus Saccharimonadales bacterium]